MMKRLIIGIVALASWPAWAQTTPVSTLPPAYANGTTQPQSQTTSGGVRSQPQDGAGHDVSSSYPLPVSAASLPLPSGAATAAKQPIIGTASAAINVSSATTTVLVAASGSLAIYVQHFDFMAAAADNVTLEYGTGASCGTGTTVLTGAYPASANGGISAGAGTAPILFVPASNALCIVTSAATQLSGSITYAQQ